MTEGLSHFDSVIIYQFATLLNLCLFVP